MKKDKLLLQKEKLDKQLAEINNISKLQRANTFYKEKKLTELQKEIIKGWNNNAQEEADRLKTSRNTVYCIRYYLKNLKTEDDFK